MSKVLFGPYILSINASYSCVAIVKPIQQNIINSFYMLKIVRKYEYFCL